MKTALVAVSMFLISTIALAETALPTPVAPPLNDSSATPIDASKPTALLVGSPQGALMLTPEMVDKIVRAQTPEYLRSIPGTPAPTALGTAANPAIHIPASFTTTAKPRTASASRATTALK